MANEIEKKRFICYELGLLSLNGALSTRDAASPIYENNVKLHQRENAKKIFREVLVSLENIYIVGKVVDEQHIAFIKKTSAYVSSKIGTKLHDGRFRIGVSQKLINLHLKYLWVTGYILEPPHCPIDGIIRDKANIKYDWTTSDSIEEYIQTISALRELAKEKSLAIWELETFRRKSEE